MYRMWVLYDDAAVPLCLPAVVRWRLWGSLAPAHRWGGVVVCSRTLYALPLAVYRIFRVVRVRVGRFRFRC